jgi:hypothetical protein
VFIVLVSTLFFDFSWCKATVCPSSSEDTSELEAPLLEDESNNKAEVGTKEQSASADTMETGSDELGSMPSEETEAEEPVLVPMADKRDETTHAEVSEYPTNRLMR